jgi:hypothetical protein
MRALGRIAIPGVLIAAGPPAVVVPWDPRPVSSDQFESHSAFDPRTGDLYFVRSKPDFTGWHILVSRCRRSGWADPRPPSFAGDGQEADPWFTRDGQSLWFISSRTTDGIRRNDLDIWRIDRDSSGRWGQPARLPAPVNSTAYEWFPRVSADGWLYFGSGRPGGIGKTDIWRARKSGGKWLIENPGEPLNSAKNEYEALPSSDGKSLIVQSDDGYFETRKTPAGWSSRRYLSDLNVNGSEIGLASSPSGRTLLFARDTKGPKSGDFFLWRRGGVEAWPPECPGSRLRAAR